MATVTKSTPVGNPKSPSKLIQIFEASFLGRSLTTLDNKVDCYRELLDQTGADMYRTSKRDAEWERYLTKSVHDALDIAKSAVAESFLAKQLKQDRDHVLCQLAEAVDAAIKNDTLPDEVRVEIQGDIIPMAPELDTCRLKFERLDKDEAVYSVHCL